MMKRMVGRYDLEEPLDGSPSHPLYGWLLISISTDIVGYLFFQLFDQLRRSIVL